MNGQPSLLTNVSALPARPRNEVCPHCGAKQVEYRHRLNGNLARVLYKIYQHGKPARLRDLTMTVPEANNLQKLRYWGFIRHIGTRDQVKTYWELTDKGLVFLANRLAVPLFVWTYRAKFRRYEGREVLVSELVKDYDWAIDYAQEARAV